MSFCQPCKDLVTQHRKAARRVAFLLVLSLLFTLLGLVANPIYMPGLCKVYP
jgi:hypothetical protein